MTELRVLMFLAVAGFAVGCSSKPAPVGEGQPAYTALQDVNDLLRASVANGRPPTKLADLEKQQGLFPRGYEAIKSGEVVVLWGTPLKGEGDVGKNEVVMAYDKAVPISGGYVLLSAGSVKKMSAADFNAAPKGGSK